MSDLCKAAEPVTCTGNGTAGREADVQPTGFFFQMPKPVAWIYEFYADMGHKGLSFKEQPSAYNTPLYTAPPKREWVGLTEDDKSTAIKLIEAGMFNLAFKYLEEKLKEKNYESS